MIYKEDTDRPIRLNSKKKKSELIVVDENDVVISNGSKLDTNSKAPLDQEELNNVISAKSPRKATIIAKKGVKVNNAVTELLYSQKNRNYTATETLNSEILLLNKQIELEVNKKKYFRLMKKGIFVDEEFLPSNTESMEDAEIRVRIKLLEHQIKVDEEKLRSLKILNDKEEATIERRSSKEIIQDKIEEAQIKEDLLMSNQAMNSRKKINKKLFRMDDFDQQLNLIQSETEKRVNEIIKNKGYNSYDEIVAAGDNFTLSRIRKMWQIAQSEIDKL